MSFTNQSADRLIQGKDALARGDCKQALKDLTVSISLAPSIEAYVIRAEANFYTGNIKAALADIGSARNLADSSPEGPQWAGQIDQAHIRYQASDAVGGAPPVEQMLSVMLPTSLSDQGTILTIIAGRPELSTDGNTLFRKGGTVIYDLEIFGRNPGWAKNMLELRLPLELPAKDEKSISGHTFFVHLQAPNQDIAQQTESQVELATEMLHTLEPLMRAIGAPVAMLRTANLVHTREEIQRFIENLSAQNIVNAYTRLYNDGDNGAMFSAGMHALGYADAQISYSLASIDTAQDLMEEFLVSQFINHISTDVSTIEFQSAVTGAVHALELCQSDRFNIDGEARFNPKGVWVFKT